MIIILLGIILRLGYFLTRRLFIWDEAALADNIISKSFVDFKVLDKVQHAPILFLWIQKTCSLIFNQFSEYTFRLFPLISSVIALICIWKLLTKFLNKSACRVAVLLLAVSSPLIYYSSVNKQYSSDVLCATIVCLIFWKFTQEIKFKTILIMGLLSALLVWLSHPVIFVLGVTSLVLSLEALIKRNYSRLRKIIIFTSFWLFSFVLNYVFVLRLISPGEQVFADFNDYFGPSILNIRNWFWYLQAIYNLYEYLFGKLAFIITGLSVWGGIHLWKNNKTLLVFLLMNIAFVLGLNVLHIYPVAARLLLFLTPIIILLAGFGLDRLKAKSPPLLAILGILLFISTLFLSVNQLFLHPQDEQGGVIEMIKQLQENYQPGDIIYAYYATDEIFKFYAPRYFATTPQFIAGVYRNPDQKVYSEDLQKLLGNPRVWIIFSHNFTMKWRNEENFMISYLDSHGKLVSSFKKDQSSLYLYNLSYSPR